MITNCETRKTAVVVRMLSTRLHCARPVCDHFVAEV